MSSSRRLRALAGALVAAFAVAPAAHAATVPDPLSMGPYSVSKIEYDAGTTLINLPDSIGGTEAIPMRGSITYSPDVDQSKIVVFVHGRHGVCIGSPSPDKYICGDATGDDGTPTQTDIRSYEGYDYMAKNLASHGYAVMSIEANITNFDNSYSDAGANARSQIIYQSLQLLWRWSNGAGPVVAGDPDHTVGTKLVGKLDFAEGLGLMGHSRGGDGVTDFVTYNRNLTGGARKFLLAGVLALAPTFYTLNKTPVGANYATLLPGCDGDVSTLNGARFFENAKYAPGNESVAKIQWFVQGTDHNYYNSVWTDDDFGPTTDPACTKGTATTARLAPADQRRVGGALMNAFMRRYVGGETAFDPIMTGAVTLPAADAPLSSGVAPSEEVKTSYVGPAAARFDILQPKPTQDPATVPPIAMDPNALTIDAAGGAISNSGFEQFLVCDPGGIPLRGQPSLPTAYPLCPLDTVTNPASPTSINRSIGTQFQLGWSGPATLTAKLGPYGTVVDATRYGVLDLRAAVNRMDPRNPQGNNYLPQSATQDFNVTLIDAAGKRATTDAAKWSTALEPSIGTSYKHVVLNGIRIPLGAFSGVDLTRLTAVELGFGTLTTSGSIELADVAFQEAGPPAPVPAASPTPTPTPTPTPSSDLDSVKPVIPPPDGPASVLPGPVIGTPAQLGGSTKSCHDATAPTSEVKSIKITRARVSITGTAADRSACASAPAAVKRTLVQLSMKVKGGCRFVDAHGRLTARDTCAAPVGVYASGTTAWSVKLADARLRRGTYRLRVITYDAANNARSLKLRTLKVA